MEEVVAVAEALGYPLGEDMVQKQIETTEGAGEIIPSTLQDRQKGKPLEVEAINGVVVRKGEQVGVSTPVNQALYALTLVLSSSPVQS
jgi:2-dehydropantoate 2-reductase